MDNANEPALAVDMTAGAGSAERLVDDVVQPDTGDEAGHAEHDDVVVIASEESDEDPLPANAALQPDGSVILTLRFPVTFKWTREGSDVVREDRRETLHMRRLTGADMRAVMAAGQGHAVTTGIAKSCRMQQGLFNKLFDRMDGSDANAAAQVFNFFLDGGGQKPTGQPSSL